MRVNATAPSVQESPGVDDPAIAYAEWRSACAVVWTAYREWTNAPKADAALAHAAYGAALDREDAAAGTFLRLARGTCGPAEGLAGSAADHPATTH
jgi:hypothetical protein